MAITLIAHTAVAAGGVYNVDFTSIPGSYDDLLLYISHQGSDFTSVAVSTSLRFNSDSASNYSEVALRGVTSTPMPYKLTNQSQIIASQPESFSSGTNYPFAACKVLIPNYSNTSYNKQIIIEDIGGRMSSDNYTTLRAGLWRSTSAITDIRVGRQATTTVGKIAQHSTFSLYGIKKA